MKRFYDLLIAIVALFVFVPLVAAADNDGDEHPVQRWDQKINDPSRFKVLSAFGGHAVLDNETGLVWQQSPSTSTFKWLNAQNHCNRLIIDGRLGWRLPTLQELASLVDPTQQFVSIPNGNPFSNVQGSGYWSATTDAGNTANAWHVDFSNLFGGVHSDDKGTFNFFVWCVRGGQGVDPQ